MSHNSVTIRDDLANEARELRSLTDLYLELVTFKLELHWNYRKDSIERVYP